MCRMSYAKQLIESVKNVWPPGKLGGKGVKSKVVAKKWL